MKLSAFELNKGIEISHRKYIDANKKYMRMLSETLYQLYDLGYQSSPNVFDKKQFLRAMAQEFDTSLFINHETGRISENPRHYQYLSRVIADREFSKVLSLYADILTAEKAFDFIDRVTERVKFYKTSDTIVIKPRYVVVNSVYDQSYLKFNNSCITDMVATNKIIKFFDIAPYLFEQIKKDYPDLAFEHEDVLKHYTDLILLNDIKTPLTPIINEYYRKFRESDSPSKACVGFFEIIFLKALDSMIDAINDLRKKLNGSFMPVYISNAGLWYTDSDESDIYKPDYENRFCMDYVTGDTLYLGIQGVFISQKEIDEAGYSSRGLAVNDYYPIFNVFDGENILAE